jgi:hypothetical protein
LVLKYKTLLMLKRLIPLLSFLFASTTTSAQQQNFVEVTVSDSLHIEADEIIYLVKALDDYTSTDTVTVDSTTFPLQPVSVSPKPDVLVEVRRIIKEMGLDTLSDPSTIVSNIRYYRIDHSIRVRFTSDEKLKQFINRLRQIENITGAVVKLESKEKEEAKKRLFRQIVQKAKTEAEMLAQLSGKKLGVIASIQEKEIMGGWTSYPPLSGIPGWHTELVVSNEDRIVLQRQFAIRFHWQ